MLILCCCVFFRFAMLVHHSRGQHPLDAVKLEQGFGDYGLVVFFDGDDKTVVFGAGMDFKAWNLAQRGGNLLTGIGPGMDKNAGDVHLFPPLQKLNAGLRFGMRWNISM